jgi:hypothetical protein
MPWRRGPRFQRRVRGQPGCSACRVGSPSPWRLRAYRAAARYLDWRFARDRKGGSRPPSSPPNTRTARQRSDHARQSAPSENRWPGVLERISAAVRASSSCQFISPGVGCSNHAVRPLPATLRLLLSNSIGACPWAKPQEYGHHGVPTSVRPPDSCGAGADSGSRRAAETPPIASLVDAAQARGDTGRCRFNATGRRKGAPPVSVAIPSPRAAYNR